MKTQYGLFLCAGVLCAAHPALGQSQPTCDKVYIGGNNGSWFSDQFWTPFGKPGPLDHVCIPADKSVQIHSAGGTVHAFCKTLWIQPGAPPQQHGTVNLRKGGRLHITDNSTVDGTLAIEKGGELLIEGDMTIWGGGGNGGGQIVGVNVGVSSDAKIVLVDHTLSFNSAYPLDSDFSLKVHGRLEIGCENNDPCPATMLINDAILVADDGPLRIGLLPGIDPLDSTAVGGTYGVWRAENDGALLFTVPVLGTAPFELVQSAAAEIILDASSTKLFGPVTIEQGTFRVRGDMKTTGNLAFSSVGGSTPSIVLENGSSVEFGN